MKKNIPTNMLAASSRKCHPPLMMFNQVCALCFLFSGGKEVFITLLSTNVLSFSSTDAHSYVNCRFPLRGRHTTAYVFDFLRMLQQYNVIDFGFVMGSICMCPVNRLEYMKSLWIVHNLVTGVSYILELDKVMIFKEHLVRIQLVLSVYVQHCNV